MGDLFAKQQSGLPTFKIADPVRDEELSELARVAAERLRRAPQSHESYAAGK